MMGGSLVWYNHSGGHLNWKHGLETSIEVLNIYRNSITSPISKNLAYRHVQSDMKDICI